MLPPSPRAAVIAVVLLSAGTVAGCSDDTDTGRRAVVPQPVAGRALGEALRGGGLVLWVRAPDGPAADFEDREHAAQVAGGLRLLGAVPTRVLAGPGPAGPYAEAALGPATTSPALQPLDPQAGHAAVGRTAGAAWRLLTAPAPAGRTTALVGSGGTLEAIAGVRLPEGATAVFRPDGAGDARLVGVVGADEWDDLR